MPSPIATLKLCEEHFIAFKFQLTTIVQKLNHFLTNAKQLLDLRELLILCSHNPSSLNTLNFYYFNQIDFMI